VSFYLVESNIQMPGCTSGCDSFKRHNGPEMRTHKYEKEKTKYKRNLSKQFSVFQTKIRQK